MTVRVAAKSGEYNIYISKDIEKVRREDVGAKCLVISDSNVWKIYGPKISYILPDDVSVYSFVFEAGEEQKNIGVINDIYTMLVEKEFDRKDTIVALGGGVTGDMAGFAAATYMRGIGFLQIPTSLLAEVDSSVGGKTGIDYAGYKNIIGSFYQPDAVYISAGFLKTLSDRDIRTGLSEIIKYGVIWDNSLFEYIVDNMQKILDKDLDVLMYLIRKSCEIKAEVVSKDERENGIRAILNFGHTIGHAVESLSGFELTHGESVALGMIAATNIAYDIGILDSREDVDRIFDAIKKAGLPVSVSDMNAEDIYTAMLHDKKTLEGKLNFILPVSIGNVEKVVIDDKSIIINALNNTILK